MTHKGGLTMNYQDALAYIEIYNEQGNIPGLLDFYKKNGSEDEQIASACESAIKSLMKRSSLSEKNLFLFSRNKPEKLVAEIITGRGPFMLQKNEEEQITKRKNTLTAFFSIKSKSNSPSDEYTNELLGRIFDANYHVKSIEALKELTSLMKMIGNKAIYIICLALIVEASNPKIFKEQQLDKDLNYNDSLSALSGLNQLLKEKKISNYKCNTKVFNESSLEHIINSRRIFFQKLQDSQVIATQPMMLYRESVTNGKGRSLTSILSYEDKKLVGKRLSQESRTQLEAVANELFRLMIGDVQPKTYLALAPKTIVSEVNPYMTLCEFAEEYLPINSLKNERDPMEVIFSDETLKKDLARITTSSLILAENDMHGGNIGFCQHKGSLRLVKIDGDEALYPLTKRGESLGEPKLISQNGQRMLVEGFSSIDCFSLNRSDLEQLPAIQIPATRDESLLTQNPSERFLPYNWAFYTTEEINLKMLQEDPIFQQAKDIAVIKFLITPQQIFTKFADKFISQPELKREFLEWIINRQHECYQKLFLTSENCINLYNDPRTRESLEEEIKEFILDMKQDGYEYTDHISFNNTIFNDQNIYKDKQYQIDRSLGKEPDIETIGNIAPLDSYAVEIFLNSSPIDKTLSLKSTEKIGDQGQSIAEKKDAQAAFKLDLKNLRLQSLDLDEECEKNTVKITC